MKARGLEGQLFREGLRLELDGRVDFDEARQFYRRAAVLGDRKAQYFLALAYASCEGRRGSRRLAMAWFRRAALAGEDLCTLVVKHPGATVNETLRNFKCLLEQT